MEDCVPRATLEEANRQYNEITAKYLILLFNEDLIINITVLVCVVIIIGIKIIIC